jgi:hypothetical protein
MDVRGATMGRGIYVVMGIAAVGWGLLLLIYVSAVAGLYQRGYGSVEAFLTGVGLPTVGLLGAIPIPALLHRKGWSWIARLVAVAAAVALLPAFYVTLMLAAI